ncbi:MAG: histidinol-phosphatase HisJ family protein [Clostridia bacterium]|nr:histidinol-phosphatase HisJ family protein [Clostridia bacterium]
MRKDFHIHPSVLQAPEGFDSFVQKALGKNIGEICITDHMPISRSTAPDRLPYGSVREYCALVRELAKRYADRIVIRCGIEVDFHPSALDEIEAVFDEGDFDFVLGSSHLHLFVDEYEKLTFNDFASLSLENSLRALEYGRFSALAHLDMYRWAFARPRRFPMIDDGYSIERHEDLIREILSSAASSGTYLEINPHLAAPHHDLFYTYPQNEIVSWALERGVRFSYGSDAHSSEAVGVLLDELEEHPIYGEALALWEKE